MKIELKSLTFENFKGIINQRIEFSKNTKIFAKNEGYKTTILDGFDWCLFDKDSLGQSDFEIKTICTNQNQSHFPDAKIGDVIHNLNHSVETVLLADGAEYKFKKIHKEKWTKKRGAARKEFTGHETDHFIDDVPIQKKEYTARVSELINEDLFRMLTDVRQFNLIHWQERRKILIELAGGVDETKINGYDLVKSILEGKSIEGMKKIVASKRKKINEELESIPVKIEENTRLIIETPESDIGKLNNQIVMNESKKVDVQREIDVTKSDSGQAERRQQIAKIETEIIGKTNEFNHGKSERTNEIQVKINNLQIEESLLKTEIRNIQDSDNQIKKEISNLETSVISAREEWKSISNKTEDIETTCPTCKQDLPEWSIKETQERYNANKSTKLENLRNEAGETKKKIEELQGKIQGDSFIKENSSKLHEISGKIAGFVKEKIEEDQKTIDLKESKYKKQALEDAIAEEKPADTSALDRSFIDLDTIIRADRKTLLDIEKNQEYRDRIKELEELEGRLSQEYAKLEGQLDKLDKFTVAKVHHIEDQINDMFGITKFKMFHEQINEGIRETCETMKDGVTYNSMNNAGRIQVGADTIHTLQKFYKTWCPMFVDNRESVTELPDMDCQVISLYVSPEDTEMRIEHG